MSVSVKKILLTGGTGLIGSRLVTALRAQGHFVRLLVRDRRALHTDEVSYWDVENQIIDPACLDGIDTIIHLAGAGIAEKRWTTKRKRVIIDSRVESISILYRIIRSRGIKINTIISASGVGFYGNCYDEVLDEQKSCGSGFLADCCRFWENAVDNGQDLCERLVKLRIGVVLAPDGGALTELERPVRWFLAAPLGSGRQWMPWVHIDDMVAILNNAVSNPLFEGAYNTCSQHPVTNIEFTKTLAAYLKRPVWPLKVPDFALRLFLGEMADVVLVSSRASSKKLVDQGFQFSYSRLNDALDEIYSR